MGRAHREIKQGLGFQSGSLSLAADPRAHEVDPSGRRAQATVILKSSAGVVLVSATACAIPCRLPGERVAPRVERGTSYLVDACSHGVCPAVALEVVGVVSVGYLQGYAFPHECETRCPLFTLRKRAVLAQRGPAASRSGSARRAE